MDIIILSDEDEEDEVSNRSFVEFVEFKVCEPQSFSSATNSAAAHSQSEADNNNNEMTEDEQDYDETVKKHWQLSELSSKEQKCLSKFTVHYSDAAQLSSIGVRKSQVERGRGKRQTRGRSRRCQPGHCVFCGRPDSDRGKCFGTLLSPVLHHPLAVHELCLMLATNLPQKSDTGPLMGFEIIDVFEEFQRAKKQKCYYCNNAGATVVCSNKLDGGKCRVAFHLPCGRKNNSFHIFQHRFPSYCSMHFPVPPLLPSRQTLKNLPFTTFNQTGTVICTMCSTGRVSMQPCTKKVIETLCCSIRTKSGQDIDLPRYYHFDCVQSLALMSGAYIVKCPFAGVTDQKKDKLHKETFQKQIMQQGIYVPIRDAEWEVDGSQDHFLYARKCYLDENCPCPDGSEHHEPKSDWEMTNCSTCGGVSIHRLCAAREWTVERKQMAKYGPWNCLQCRQL